MKEIDELAFQLAEQEVTATDTSLIPRAVAVERRAEELAVELREERGHFGQGYAVLMEQLHRHRDALDKPPEEYLIRPEIWEKCQQLEVIEEAYSQGQSLQHVIGYSDEMMLDIYDRAVELSESCHYEESIHAFAFLTVINPRVVAFWIGKGVAHLNHCQVEEGAKAFETAFEVDPSDIRIYEYLIKLHLGTQQKEHALEVLERGRTLSREASDQERWNAFNTLAPELERVIHQFQ